MAETQTGQQSAVAILPEDRTLTPAAATLMAMEAELGHALQFLARPQLLAMRLEKLFEERKMRRRPLQDEWLEAHQRYMGEYPEHIRARMHPAKSHLWVGLTTMKVNSAHAAIMDFLRGNPDDRPWSLEPPDIADNTPLPEEWKQLGINVGHYRQLIREGVKAMQDEITNQYEQMDFAEELDLHVLEMAITGTGGAKGPLTVKDVDRYWQMDFATPGIMNEVEPQNPYKPVCRWASVFNLYPDMEAPNVEQGSGIFEELLLTRRQMLELALRPGVNVAAVLQVLREAPNGQAAVADWQSTLRAIHGDARPTETNRYSVKCYFGEVTGEELRETGMAQISDEARFHAIRGEVWYCGQYVLKAKVHEGPIPYYLVPYIRRGGSIPFGRGVPMLARHSQDAVNGAARAIMDNAAIASGPIGEVNTGLLKLDPAANPLDIHAWKIYLSDHDGHSGKRAVNFTDIPAYTNEFMMIVDKFRQLMDEETFLPSITQGLQGIGVTKTATGMSLLNSNANKTLKMVMRNIDDRLIRPMTEAMVDWNLRFNPKENIRVPLKVRARGSASLLATEVRTQRMLTLLQIIAGDPNYKTNTLVNQLASELGIEPTDINFSEDERRAMQAELGQVQGAPGGGQGAGAGGGGGPGPGAGAGAPASRGSRNQAQGGRADPGFDAADPGAEGGPSPRTPDTGMTFEN